MPKSMTFSLSILLLTFGSSTVLFGQKDWVEFKKSTYRLKYPESWTLDTTHQTAADLIVMSPLKSDKDFFAENLNLVIQDLKGLNFDLDNFTDLSEQQIQSYLEGSELIESKRMTRGDKECQHLVYTAKRGEATLRFEQYYWILDEKAYILSFTGELEKFEEYQDLSKRILDSFEIK